MKVHQNVTCTSGMTNKTVYICMHNMTHINAAEFPWKNISISVRLEISRKIEKKTHLKMNSIRCLFDLSLRQNRFFLRSLVTVSTNIYGIEVKERFVWPKIFVDFLFRWKFSNVLCCLHCTAHDVQMFESDRFVKLFSHGCALGKVIETR